jgi:CheY-like chemotaxis protein
MQNIEDLTNQPVPDSEAKGDDLLKAFASALGRELDRVGYPGPPARTNQLAHDLGLGRMQAYRITRGDNMPTLKSLMRLHRLGVSLDSVLAQVHGGGLPQELPVSIQGVAVRAIPMPAYLPEAPFVVSERHGHRGIYSVDPGGEVAPGDVPVGGLWFTGPLPYVLVVEDDEPTFTVLCAELAQGFRTKGYGLGLRALQDGPELAKFDALVLDWRLPDIDGAELVRQLREHTQAPIIITTGAREEAQAISATLRLPNIRYVGKPIDGDILRATIDSSIAESKLAQALNASRPAAPGLTNV